MIKLNGKEVRFEKFPNGETRMVGGMELDATVESYNKILFKYENDSDLIKLLFVKNYLDSWGDYLLNELTLAYMPYSRMDRSELNSPFTLKYVSKFINDMKFTKVIVVEPHSDVTPALLDNAKSKYINFDLLPLVENAVYFDKDIDYLFFPDAGAQKRYHSLRGYKQLVGHKNRDFHSGDILGLEVVGNITPMSKMNRRPNILIVDDLSSKGGTFVHSSIALKKLGFDKVYLLVAHAENTIFQGELFDHVDKVFTTDSILTEQNYFQNMKFRPQLTIFNIEGALQ